MNARWRRARRLAVVVVASFGIGVLAMPLSPVRLWPLLILVAVVAVANGGDS